MPVPIEYKTASDDFTHFLMEVREESMLWSTHASYTMVQGVFQTFRRRISVPDAIAFANLLPVCLRALFVTDWDLAAPIRPFDNRETLTAEVRSLRPNHNFSPDTAIRDVARVLRRFVSERELDRLVSQLPEGAADYWSP